MGINEKQPTDKKYIIILRNNAAIEVECADVYMKESWTEFKDEYGLLLMAIPIDLILMITTPDRFAVFQRAAEDARAQQQVQPGPILSVDPVATLVQTAPIIQP